MNRINLIFLFLIVLQVSGASNANERDERNAVKHEVHTALLAGKFEHLRDIHNRIETSKTVTTSGYPHIISFWEAIAESPNGTSGAIEAYLNRRDQLTKKWISEHPDSALAISLHAKSLLGHGLYYRGGDYAKNISAANMQTFKQYAQVANTFLLENKAVGDSEPAWYANTIESGRYLNVDDQNLWPIFKEAQIKFPSDQMAARNLVISLLPKWGGDCCKLDEVIRESAHVGAKNQDLQIYARLYLVAQGSQFEASLLDKTKVNWNLMRSGLIEIESQYPTDWNRNLLAFNACMAGDKALTQKTILALKNSFIEDRWFGGGREAIERCKNWSQPFLLRNRASSEWSRKKLIVGGVFALGSLLFVVFLRSRSARRRRVQQLLLMMANEQLEKFEMEIKRVIVLVEPDGPVDCFFLESTAGDILFLEDFSKLGTLNVDTQSLDQRCLNFPATKLCLYRSKLNGQVFLLEPSGDLLDVEHIECDHNLPDDFLERMEDAAIVPNLRYSDLLRFQRKQPSLQEMQIEEERIIANHRFKAKQIVKRSVGIVLTVIGLGFLQQYFTSNLLDALFLVSLLVLAPITLVLYSFDLHRHLSSIPNPSGRAKLVLFFSKTPVILVSLFCLCFAIAAVVWIGYNLLVERQDSFKLEIPGLLFLAVIGYAGWRMLKKALFKKPKITNSEDWAERSDTRR